MYESTMLWNPKPWKPPGEKNEPRLLSQTFEVKKETRGKFMASIVFIQEGYFSEITPPPFCGVRGGWDSLLAAAGNTHHRHNTPSKLRGHSRSSFLSDGNRFSRGTGHREKLAISFLVHLPPFRDFSQRLHLPVSFKCQPVIDSFLNVCLAFK